MAPIVVFKSVSSPSEKKNLFDKITSGQGEIFLKDKNDEIAVLKAESINADGQLHCSIPVETNLKFGLKSVLTATFMINNEKYLFETSVSPFENGLNLTILNLFHLQRRKNFRYTIPSNYAADFVVTTLNQKKSNTSCRLLDLSTEGCAILMTLEMQSLQVDDRLEASILLGDRDVISIQGFVKNLRISGDDLILGIEFNHLANASEHAITTAITDMQRELYLRKAG